MSQEAQRVYLTRKFTDAGVGLPVQIPNIDSNIPENAPYGEFHIVANAPPVTLGGEGKGKVRRAYVGFVQLTVWIPEGKGTKTATQTGDKFEAIFAGKLGRDSAGQTYEFDGMQSFAPTTKNGWSCSVFRVSFRRMVVEEVQINL